MSNFAFSDRGFKGVLQPQDGRIPCPMDRNLEFVLISILIVCSFLDNAEIIVNKICF